MRANAHADARIEAITLGGLVALAAVHFAGLRPDNFGGYDEWLIVSLSSQSIIGFPQANRPFVLLWSLLGAAIPDSLTSYMAAHVLYLVLTALCAVAIVRRLAPSVPLAGVLAGAFALTWAPLDDVRLDSVLMVGYSGNTFATHAAVVLLLESWRRGRPALLAAAAALAFVAARAGEVVIPLLVAAPMLLALVPSPRRLALRWWVLAWETPVLLAAAAAAGPVLFPSAGGSYQGSALGLDAHPVRWLGRIFQLLGFHLLPAVQVRPVELARLQVAAAAAVFAVILVAVLRHVPALDSGHRRECRRLVAVGAVAAVLADSFLALTPAIRNASRTQVLSAPAVGLLLAAALCLVATMGRTASWLAAALAVAVVGIGTGRTMAMQEDWNERTAFPAQRRSLAALRSALPGVRPNTLIVLLDDAGTWPATFTFRHALHHLYGPRVIGFVPGAHDYLYPCRFVAAGVACEPWPAIREAWRSPPTFHRFEEIVVVRDRGSDAVEVVDPWPASALPAKPPEAIYAPAWRIAAGDAHVCRIVAAAASR